MRSRSVSLTGATGFVGWHLAEAFRDAGWRVRAIVRSERRQRIPPGVGAVEGSLFGSDALTAALAGSDVVVHCAGVIRAKDEHAFNRVNVDGTRAVVQAVNRAGGRLLLISSLGAGGPGTVSRPRLENDPPAPVNAYGRSKLGGEEVVRRESLTPWVILRPSAVYGARDRGFLPLFRLAQRGWYVRPTPGNMAFTLINVADLARAVVLAAEAERAAGETLFLGHRQPQTTDQIMRTLAEFYGRRYAPIELPLALVRGTASLGDLAWKVGWKFVFDSGRLAEFSAAGFVCSVDRARDVLGFTAETALADGFAQTASWYREQGWV